MPFLERLCARSTVFHHELGSATLAKKIRAVAVELENVEEKELEHWCMRLSLGLARALNVAGRVCGSLNGSMHRASG